MLENESKEKNDATGFESWPFEEEASVAAVWPSEPARLSRLCARVRSAASPLELAGRIREHSGDILPCQDVLVFLGAAFDLRLVIGSGPDGAPSRPAHADWLMQLAQSLVGQAGMTHRFTPQGIAASLRDGWPSHWPRAVQAYRLQDRLGRAAGLVVYVPSSEWPAGAELLLEALHHVYGASLEVAARLQEQRSPQASLGKRLLARLGMG